MTVQILPFQTDDICCPKCRTKFRLFTDTCKWTSIATLLSGESIGEHLALECPTCGFRMVMACAAISTIPEGSSPDMARAHEELVGLRTLVETYRPEDEHICPDVLLPVIDRLLGFLWPETGETPEATP